MIPVFVALIVDEDTTTAGLIVFGVVVATDWVDGTIARRTGQVSELGKVLDPVADRLAIAAGHHRAGHPGRVPRVGRGGDPRRATWWSSWSVSSC